MTEKIIVAGSRSILDYQVVDTTLRHTNISDISPHNWDVEIVTGGADGVDTSAERFARDYGLELSLFDPYNPNETKTDHSYNKELKQAFLKRNEEMAQYGDRLVAIWDGHSNGTRDMIDKALDAGLPTYVEIYDE